MREPAYHPALKTFKPDIDDAVRRWEAFYAGEMIDRPIVVMAPPRDGCVMPALEEEAEIVRHVSYHWDGPGARVHEKTLVASKGLHTLSFVPGDGGGDHVDYLDMLERLQAGGKAVHVWGTPEQCQFMHRRLRPEKTLYHPRVKTPAEADALIEWFVSNT